MNITSFCKMFCLFLAITLLTAGFCFASETQGDIQEISEVSVLPLEDADFEGALFECVICVEHEDFVMGMDGYHESLVENMV